MSNIYAALEGRYGNLFDKLIGLAAQHPLHVCQGAYDEYHRESEGAATYNHFPFEIVSDDLCDLNERGIGERVVPCRWSKRDAS